MTVDATDLRRRMARLGDEQLLDILTTHRRSYRQVAVDLAAEELRRRGLSLSPPVTAQTGARRSRRAAPTAQPYSDTDGLALVCEIMCAVLGSLILTVLFVSGRETQKVILRWAGTSLALPYMVWRGARYLDRRWPGAAAAAPPGQTIN